MNVFKNKNVKTVFDGYPVDVKKQLLILRQLIFEIASENENIGELEETLKWEQPSYLTSNPKSGTILRLGYLEASEYAIYVHCQTTLIAEFNDF